MQFLTDVRVLLGYRYFRRLFAVRLVSQFSDGVFQSALASYVLFSPERQPTAAGVAAGFAVLLLPFSLLGPFCGVLLDRWSRRQVLLVSNAIRSGLALLLVGVVGQGGDGLSFFVIVLACLSINRFLLAALSACLPRVVPTERLVIANAVSPTCGTLAYLTGLGMGTAAEALSRSALAHAELVVLAVATLCYLAAALLALRIPRALLGPAWEAVRPAVRESVRHIFRGFVDGARHVLARRPAALGLAAIGVQRFFYTVSLVAAILLYRNYFEPHDPSAALAGIGAVVLASGLGYGAAAFLTPVVVRRVRKETWIVVLFVVGAVAVLLPGAFYTPVSMIVVGFAFGLTAQGIKICVDTLVQENIEDVYRGRVFSLYDVLFNVVFVAAAAFAAATLPMTGRSYAVLAATSAAYVLAALVYARLTGLWTGRQAPSVSESGRSHT